MNAFSNTINERVMQAKRSIDEKNQLIQEYKPFIAASVEKSLGRYVSYGQDDELSIGLIAFDEAIEAYNPSKGSFLGFAKGVIHKRLIDYYRKEKKHHVITYISEYDQDHSDADNSYDSVITSDEVKSKYFEQEINELRKIELIQLKDELEKWGLKFSDIAKSSPKHKATKQSYLSIIKCIIENKALVEKMKTKLYLPVAEIEEATKLPRKTIERARNYIIAAVIILSGDYYCIREFIDWGWMK